MNSMQQQENNINEQTPLLSPRARRKLRIGNDRINDSKSRKAEPSINCPGSSQKNSIDQKEQKSV